MTSASEEYYGSIGLGSWRGTFILEVRSWRGLLRARIGVGYTALVLGLLVTQRVLGPARIGSRIKRQSPVSFTNDYRLTKLRVPLCDLRDAYHLRDDGTHVDVRTDVRLGPIPGLFESHTQYVATISNQGFTSRYDGMPLLGSTWIGRYWAHPDRDRICGVLTCSWAEAVEVMARA